MLKTHILIGFLFVCCLVSAQTGSKNIFQFKDPGKASIRDIINQAKLIGKKDSAAATRLFMEAIAAAKKSEDNYAAGLAYYEMAEMNGRFGNHNKAFGGYFNAKPLFEKARAEKESAYTLFGLAREQYYRGAINHAVNHLNFSILEARKYQLKQLEADALEYLAMVYNEIPYYEKRSTPDLLKSLHIKQQLNDQKGIVHLLTRISKGFADEKKYDSALYYADAGLQLALQLQMPEAAVIARLAKTDLLILQQHLSTAAAELDTVRNGLEKLHNTNLLISYHSMKTNFLLTAGNDDAAMMQFDSAMALGKKRESPEAVCNLYRKMSDAYARRNDFQKAYDFQREYNNLFTKLYNPANASRYDNAAFLIGEKLAKDEVKYLSGENEIKRLRLLTEQERRRALERENSLMDSIIQQEKNLSAVLSKAGDGLKRENSYKNTLLNNERVIRAADTARLKEEKRVRITLIIGLATAITLATIIFLQYKRQQKKNLIIGKQSNELQTLMKEIHHRVKNNLQIISSLLDLQAASMQHKEASEAVREGKNRVQSMALIHQNLYNDGNVRGISMKGYINHLAQHLFDSYNILPEKIKLVTDIESLSLDVDTAIPIGLVLNELISNSLKYAFTNRESGEISVQLTRQQNSLFLQVKDNGHGFPPRNDASPPVSFGMKLLNTFSKKLKAKLEIYNDNGACVSMRIDRFKTTG